MKMKRILAWIITLVMAISLLPTVAFAIEATDRVSEVELTLPVPRAGETVNLSFTSVEAKHHMTYKVVGLRWYKQGDDRQMGKETGADTYFIGGQTYTVEVDLEVKSGNSGWKFEYAGVDTDYSGIHATINGKSATVKYPPLNADKHKTVTVAYTFEYIADGIINYPSVTIPTPIAGNTVPDREDVVVGNSRALWIPTTEYLWYIYEGNAWRKLEQNETFAAGARYKVELALAAMEGFHFNIENATDLRNDGNKHIWGYINGQKRSMTLKALGVGQDGVMQYDDEIVYVNFEFTSCEAQYINSVSFGGITAPSATQHPQYYAPTMGGVEYSLLLDDAYTGGAKYNFVNGVQWSSPIGLLNENSVFEQGVAYSMTFFIKSVDTHRFTDWVEGSANIGYVDVMTLPEDPTIAMVTISFAPCNGGILREVNIGGVAAPVHGQTPDYDFVYGQGYSTAGFELDTLWFDVTAGRAMSKTDTFIYGHEYELVTVMKSDKADGGIFEFAPHSELTVTINGTRVANINKYNGNPEGRYVEVFLAFQCEKAILDVAALTVETPKEGNAPAKQIARNGDQFTIESFMFVDGDTDMALNEDDVFVAGKEYRFVLLIAPTEAYKFETGVTVVKVNGQEAGILYAEEYGALVCLTFMAEELPYCQVTFDAGEGSGVMSDLLLKGSFLFVLPECEFEPPEGKHFIGWSNDYGETILLGLSYYLDGIGSLNLMAVYEDDEHHEHIYSPEFNAYDEFSHYKTCVSPSCPEYGGYTTKSIAPGDEMMHQYDNDCDDTCDDCGYVRTTNHAGDPLHFFGYACVAACPNCGMTREAADHTPGAAATCTEPQKCSVCQKVLEEAKGHNPGAEANCGQNQTCTDCGMILAESNGTHTPGAEATCTQSQKCTVCGADLKPANGHVAGVEWIADENGHHKLCACGEKVEAGTHKDANGDKRCDTCGYEAKGGFTDDGQGKTGLGTGAILAIVGAIIVIGGGFCLYWFVIKKKNQK